MTNPQITWRQSFLVYTKPAVLAMFFLGFSAGLPLLLVFSTLSAWLTESGVSRTTIGFFGWVGVTYSVKVFWAPVVDRLPIPWLTSRLGQRRSWILLGQLGVVAGLLGMINCDPQTQLVALALCSVCVAFASSTQDVAVDAFRIESAVVERQGAMSATYVFGYRIAMLVAGGVTLLLAEMFGWQAAYAMMAACMLVGIVTVLVVREPEHEVGQQTNELEQSLIAQVIHHPPKTRGERLAAWFSSAVVAPFVDFFRRNGRFALLILAFIGAYRLSDITMGIMANPFYLDLGFTKTEIFSVVKGFGVVMTIIGSFVGGIVVVRFGVFRPLLAGAVMVAVTNLFFVQLAVVGPDIQWLTAAISADNFSAGFASAAFLAYLAGLTNRAYTATQYALFSSLMTLPGKFVSGFSGLLVDAYDYQTFFLYAALMGVPAVLLAWTLMRHHANDKAFGVTPVVAEP